MSRVGADRPGATGAPPPDAVVGRGRRIRQMVAVALVVVGADQVTKSLAVSRLSSGAVHLIGPFSLSLSYNTGVAFSIGTGLGLPIVLVVVVIVALVAWFGRTVPNLVAATALGMILGGAIGNLADRLLRGHHGAVVDFIYSGFWPTFNLADASIVCGCVLLAISLYRKSPQAGSPGRNGEAAR